MHGSLPERGVFYWENMVDIFGDTPNHESGLTSSIGGLWPPEPASFRRVKAFYTPSTIGEAAANAAFWGNFIREKTRMINGEATRVQFRAIYRADYLASVAAEISKDVEAVIPLGENRLGDDLVLVYLGANTETRQPSHDDLCTIRSNLEIAQQTQKRSPAEIFSRAEIRGYAVNILNIPQAGPEQEVLIDEMTGLYQRFGWNREEVRELLLNSNNIVSVARKGGNIVSAGIAEIATIPLGGQKLTAVEITEAATLDEHAGQGLYTAVSTRLLEELARRSKENPHSPVDLVFGECNGLSLGVLKTAKTQGRIFAAEVGSLYGFNGSGLLKQQVPISGPPRKTEHNDLLPAFLTGKMLIEYYG